MEMELRKLKDELRAEKEERMEMERRWRECAETLERKQLEDEEQYSQLAAREEQLEQNLTTLRKEKFASQLEAESINFRKGTGTRRCQKRIFDKRRKTPRANFTTSE